MKDRNHEAYLSISASGPLFAENVENSTNTRVRLRSFADLEYTTADVDFYEEHWNKEWARDGKYKFHQRLRNPKVCEVYQAIYLIGAWFAQYKESDDWLGGRVTIAFAGHGKENEGSLVLDDGEITVTELYEVLCYIRPQDNETLRVSMLLDSCYSGKFIVDFLHKAFEDSSFTISPDYFGAACLHDEEAIEEPELGHGLYTYCFQQQSFGPYRGIDIDPVSYEDQEVKLFVGITHGCSLLTFGKQNPIRFDNSMFDACGQSFFIFRDDKDELLSKEEIYTTLELFRFFFEDELKRVRNSGQYVRMEHITEKGIEYENMFVGKQYTKSKND